MTLIRHPFLFFSAAIRCYVYKKNKQQVYLFDLEGKKGKALERGQRLEALLPKGWSRRLHDYPYPASSSHAGAERGETALHCGPKGGAWDLKAEQGRKAVSSGQGGQSETLTSASIRVTAALIPTAAPVRPPTLSPRLGIGLNWARKCVQAAQRQDKFQNPLSGSPERQGWQKDFSRSKKMSCGVLSFSQRQPHLCLLPPPTCSHHAGSGPRGTSEILDGGWAGGREPDGSCDCPRHPPTGWTDRQQGPRLIPVS